MTELGVGHEATAVDDRRADAGAERGEDDQAVLAPGRPERQLADPGGVGVVDDDDVVLEAVLEELLDLAARSTTCRCWPRS